MKRAEVKSRSKLTITGEEEFSVCFDKEWGINILFGAKLQNPAQYPTQFASKITHNFNFFLHSVRSQYASLVTTERHTIISK